MATHDCPECGLTHSIPDRGETEAVRIARINADRDIEVARLQRAEAKLDAETELAAVEVVAGTETAVAEIEAESGVEAAEAVADALAPPEPEPQVIEVAAEPAPDATEDEAGTPADIERATPKSHGGGGYWSGYSAT